MNYTVKKDHNKNWTFYIYIPMIKTDIITKTSPQIYWILTKVNRDPFQLTPSSYHRLYYAPESITLLTGMGFNGRCRSSSRETLGWVANLALFAGIFSENMVVEWHNLRLLLELEWQLQRLPFFVICPAITPFTYTTIRTEKVFVNK